jgi:hypothetical protein
VVRRKGELNRARIDSDWPYQIALPIETAGGHNTIIIQRFCIGLTICPRHKRYLGSRVHRALLRHKGRCRVLPDVLRRRVRRCEAAGGVANLAHMPDKHLDEHRRHIYDRARGCRPCARPQPSSASVVVEAHEPE